jgi:hypothetical protein
MKGNCTDWALLKHSHFGCKVRAGVRVPFYLKNGTLNRISPPDSESENALDSLVAASLPAGTWSRAGAKQKRSRLERDQADSPCALERYG